MPSTDGAMVVTGAGGRVARKMRRSLANLRAIIAADLLCAAHGLGMRAPLVPAPATGAVLDLIRTRVDCPGPDRPLAADPAAAEELVASRAVVSAAEAAAGALG